MAEEHGGGKPAEFFVGLVDFFGILMPGVLLTFWIYEYVNYAYPDFWKGLPFPHENWVIWAGFFVIAYVAGHLLYVIGSWCVDDVYDWWKETAAAKQGSDIEARQQLKEIADSELARLAETAGIDSPAARGFKMLPVYLRIWNAGAVAEMDRLEADQKFFRGLILVLLIIWPSFFMIRVTPDSPILTRGLLGLLGLAPFLVPLMQFERIKPEKKRRKFQCRGWQAALVWLLLWLVVPVGFWYYMPQLPIPSPPHFAAPPAPRSDCGGTTKSGQTATSTTAPKNHSNGAKAPLRDCQRTTMSTKAVILIAIALFVSLSLSIVRFGQQRLKYTLFIYRAFLGLQFPGPSSAAAGGTAER